VFSQYVQADIYNALIEWMVRCLTGMRFYRQADVNVLADWMARCLAKLYRQADTTRTCHDWITRRLNDIQTDDSHKQTDRQIDRHLFNGHLY